MEAAGGGDPPATPLRSPKEEHTWRRALEEARSEWSLSIRDRVTGLQRGGRFAAVTEAADEALARFPDERAVDLVRMLLRRIPGTEEIHKDAGGDRVAGWAQELSFRALERLPTPPSIAVQGDLLLRIGVNRDASGQALMGPALAALRRRAADAHLAGVRQLLDAIDPLWDETERVDQYPPAHPGSPEARSGQGQPGPSGEAAFRRAEDAYYTAALRMEEQRDLPALREDRLRRIVTRGV